METISLKIPQNLQFTDDEFYDFCQANPELKLERTSTGKILIMALTGGKTGIKNTEIIAELTLWNRKTVWAFYSTPLPDSGCLMERSVHLMQPG
jgi:Uma2 family endonuclease